MVRRVTLISPLSMKFQVFIVMGATALSMGDSLPEDQLKGRTLYSEEYNSIDDEAIDEESNLIQLESKEHTCQLSSAFPDSSGMRCINKVMMREETEYDEDL